MITVEQIESEAYKLIRRNANRYGSDDKLIGAYTRGVFDIQTVLYELSQK